MLFNVLVTSQKMMIDMQNSKSSALFFRQLQQPANYLRYAGNIGDMCPGNDTGTVTDDFYSCFF